MKKILLSISLLALVGCQLYQPMIVRFEVANMSGGLVRDIEVFATEEVCDGINYISYLEHGELDELSLDFSYEEGSECVHASGDGEYGLFLQQNEQEYEYRFGYYSNGIPLDSEFIIEIREDGVFVNGFAMEAKEYDEKELCEQEGGIFGPQGKLGIEQCNLPAIDAGLSCLDSEECEGLCLNVEGEGKCSARQINFVCSDVLNQGEPVTICID